jgi:dihydrofolate reductase
MKVSIIAAVAQNNVIGNNNSLIWHMPADLKFFKAKTTGHVIIMGRNTFESIGGGRPLPNRKTIVITRNLSYTVPEGVYIAHSLAEALELFPHETEVFICGGAQIYSEALSVAHCMYLTQIHATFEGDTYFPEFSHTQWQRVNTEHYTADEKNPYDYSFETWELVTD